MTLMTLHLTHWISATYSVLNSEGQIGWTVKDLSTDLKKVSDRNLDKDLDHSLWFYNACWWGDK